MFCNVQPSVFAEKLKGKTVVSVKRRGKHLWIELTEKPFPLFHFGMTGKFVVQIKQLVQVNLDTELNLCFF